MSYYPIELDKTRNLKYGMRAIDRVEKKLKIKISQMDFNNLSMEETAVVIWAGLVHEDKNLTPERIMDLVDEYSNITKIGDDITNAINEAFGINESVVVEEKNE
ncbi:MAG TPA: hypothetical protein DHW61_02135 [Lachnoclostridium phytofermentans]|uniref:Uncharacterized protein n=1 Tax=Lachnoclostridium phytofermentans TaxID=66219 RepID=A0A3D2X2K6_9FIRM|nr:hypothetical protein [Lachnoclostridium sp.]HCL01206.1 hypothetical protein [Lachnoclostridium phytofermentans]